MKMLLQASADDSAGGDRKRSSTGSAKDPQASPKKRKTRTFDIDLPNAPVDGKLCALVIYSQANPFHTAQCNETAFLCWVVWIGY